jgi:riboflavin-specific deaminase-like protein
LTRSARILQLLPEQREVALADAYDSLDLQARAPAGRPYVVANMVATADGRATVGGRTKELSSDADRELFHRLREQVDGVMAGVATIAIENYGPLVRDPERRERRAARGLERLPLAVTATRSMELPVATKLFADEESRVVVLTNSDREAPRAAAQVTVERLGGDVLDLGLGLAVLRERHGIRALLLEGGPTLLAAMIAARLVDELFLSLAPWLVGAEGEPSILEGPLGEPATMRMLSAFYDDNHLFLRYGLSG